LKQKRSKIRIKAASAALLFASQREMKAKSAAVIAALR
jgi:hypothetical protein